jgi:hypothetical protein
VPNAASKANFDELKKHSDDGQIAEIVASIALFWYLNRWNDAMATGLEDHSARVAARTIGRSGGLRASMHGSNAAPAAPLTRPRSRQAHSPG